MTSRYEFLTKVHALRKPKTYLEVGVQTGGSLALAYASEQAIGIDPVPLTTAVGNQTIHRMTADDYFHYIASPDMSIDMAFIDGSHLFEDALRDFFNVEFYSHPGTVVIFDDALPYNQAIAERVQPPGDWTGDVWKIHEVLKKYRPELRLMQVDTFPTGSLVVTNLWRENSPILASHYLTILSEWLGTARSYNTVPDYILNRTEAVSIDAALEALSL